MKFDKYNLIARIFPSAIVLIPFLLFTFNCEIEILKQIFDDLLKAKIIGNITISIVLLYFLTQINRFLGKFLFEKQIFKNELEMPTTNFLLYKNPEFSKQYKNKIRAQIKSDFQIELPTEIEEEENIEDTRKQIVEAVGLIRQKVKNGRLLLQHNIEYGFARNLVGGSIVGFIISVFDITFFYIKNDNLIAAISLILAIIFVVILFIHKPIIKHLGNQYAKRLYQEYLQK